MNCLGRNFVLFCRSFGMYASRRYLRNFTLGIRFRLNITGNLFSSGNVCVLRFVRSSARCIYHRSDTGCIKRIGFGILFCLRRNTTIQRLRSINRSRHFDRLLYTNCTRHFLFGVRFRCRFNRRFVSGNCGVIKRLTCRSTVRSFGNAGAFQRRFDIHRCRFFVSLFISSRSIRTLDSRLPSASSFFTLHILFSSRHTLRLLVLDRRSFGCLGGRRCSRCRVRDCASSNIRVLVARSLRTSDFELKSTLRDGRGAAVGHTHRGNMTTFFKRFCKRSKARILVFVLHNIIFHCLFGVVRIIVNRRVGTHHVSNTVFVRHTNLVSNIFLFSFVLLFLNVGSISGSLSQFVHHGFIGLLIVSKESDSRCGISIFLMLRVIIPIGINCKGLRSICFGSNITDFVAVRISKLRSFPDVFAFLVFALRFQLERAFFVGYDCRLTTVANSQRRCRSFSRRQAQTIACIGRLDFTRRSDTSAFITLDGSCVKRTILADFDALNLFAFFKRTFGLEDVLHCFLMSIIVIGSCIDRTFVQTSFTLSIGFIKVSFCTIQVSFGKCRILSIATCFVAAQRIKSAFTIAKSSVYSCANARKISHHSLSLTKRVNTIHPGNFQTGRLHHIIKLLRNFQKRIRDKRPGDKFCTGATNHTII